MLLAHTSRKLDAERAAVLEEHLANCPACREYAAAQFAVWEALDAWEAPEVSADFDRRLYARIDEEVGDDDGKFLALIDGRWYPARAVEGVEATIGRL